MLRKSPAFLLIATLSLALGIGADTAIFTLIDQVLLRPLRVKNPQPSGSAALPTLGIIKLGLMAPVRPLSALLSQLLVAFTVEFDGEFERRMGQGRLPWRTATAGGVDESDALRRGRRGFRARTGGAGGGTGHANQTSARMFGAVGICCVQGRKARGVGQRARHSRRLDGSTQRQGDSGEQDLAADVWRNRKTLGEAFRPGGDPASAAEFAGNRGGTGPGVAVPALQTSGVGWQIKPYVLVTPDPNGRRGKVVQLSPRGLTAQRTYFRLTGEIEKRWESKFGGETMGQLCESLEGFFNRQGKAGLLLSECLLPPPGTVRAGDLAPALGRRAVGAAARQRMRDLIAQTEAFVRDPVGALPHYPMWDINRGFGP